MTYDYSVSARKKLTRQPVGIFLKMAYPDLLKNNEIKTVFGFRERCSLYGGRKFEEEELSEQDIHWLYDHGIGYRIPVQNTAMTFADYQRERPFLKKYHRQGNVLIIAKSDFSEWVRNDYPEYKVEGSFIRRYDNVEKIIEDLKTFDTVVPDPAVFGTDYELLNQLPRDRVRLFTNAWCGMSCKKRLCYTYLSLVHVNRTPNVPFCSEEGVRVETLYDVDKYKEMGFTLFKSMKISSRLPGL